LFAIALPLTLTSCSGGKEPDASKKSESERTAVPAGSAVVTDFGAKSDTAASGELRRQNAKAIQDAVDSLRVKRPNGGVVYFPPGVYQIDRTIEFDSGITFQGANVNASVIDSNQETGAIFARRLPQKNRPGHVFFRDLQITNTSPNRYTRASTKNKSIGIDFTNCSQSGIHTVKIEYVNIGILIEGRRENVAEEEQAALYIDLYSPLISGVYIGIRCRGHNKAIGNDPGGGSANETHVFGGRVADATTGIELNDINNFQVYSTAIESFDTGIDLQEDVAGTKIIGCRFEPVSDKTKGQGIRITKSATRTLILGHYFENTMRYPIHDYAPEIQTTIIPTPTKEERIRE